MPRQFLEVTPAGFNSDLAPYTVPPDTWTAARNVRFNGSSGERFGGSSLIYTATEAYIGNPEFAYTTFIAGQPWILYGGDWGVGVTNGTNHWNVTPAGWQPIATPGSVTGGTINNIIVFNHVDNVPFYWDGTTVAGAVKPLPGWPAATFCRLLRPFRSHLFAGDILSGAGRQQDLLLWSDAAPVGSVPPTWAPTATNQAGSFPLPDGLGAIVEMQPMHDYALAYKQGAAYAIRFVGRPYIYSFNRIAAVVGAVSPNAVCVLRGSHVTVSAGDIVRLDGAQAQSIIDQRVRKAIFRDYNAEAAGVVCNVHYPARSEVWFGLPVNGSNVCNLAAIWNYNTDKWTLRDLPGVDALSLTILRPNFVALIWSTQTQPWNSTQGSWNGIRYAETNLKVIGCSKNYAGIIAFDTDDLELGQPLEGKLERTSMPVGGTAKIKHFQHVYPRFSGQQGTTILCRIGVQLEASDAINWGAERAIVIDPSKTVQGIPVLAQGKFLSVSMRSYQTAGWTVDGFGVEFQERARY
jgi:hypothetical protein